MREKGCILFERRKTVSFTTANKTPCIVDYPEFASSEARFISHFEHKDLYAHSIFFLGSYKIRLYHTSASVSDVASPSLHLPLLFFLDLSSAPAARTMKEVKIILTCPRTSSDRLSRGVRRRVV
jgi:hypothetical protein